MKALITGVLLVLLPSLVLRAQDIEEMKLPWKTGQKIALNLKFGQRITVEAWDKKEISVKAEVTINAGTLNHAHKLDSTISDQEIEILADLDEEIVGKNFWCDCDKQGNWRYSIQNKENHKWVCSQIYYTVHLPAGADLDLKTISGDIKITNMKGIIEAESVSGAVDVVIPAGSKADVRLKSVMGRVTSDPDLATEYQGLKPMLARKLNGKLNGGGKNVHLESVMGDVTLKSVQ
jgi:hypothetical protein